VVNGKIVPQREAPRRHAERAFGRDVQHVGIELADRALDPPCGNSERRISG
jgi:hypothetical protein